ncbi:hypothetical protein MNBD_CHLOROFLEXI01-2645 [hydrothermal vent metagenome]|uniref:BrnT family toxin n=1 Tax=hydrothermal vent metagenome TaxID=652676 RepID=A0A3B0VVX9_9ZZZZ
MQEQGFAWDNGKRLANLQKHTIDFEDAITIFDGDIVTVEDARFNYGEQRFITLGLLKGRVIAVVHTEKSEITRIISARKATKYGSLGYHGVNPISGLGVEASAGSRGTCSG